jgi:hypothetical protein
MACPCFLVILYETSHHLEKRSTVNCLKEVFADCLYRYVGSCASLTCHKNAQEWKAPPPRARDGDD